MTASIITVAMAAAEGAAVRARKELRDLARGKKRSIAITVRKQIDEMEKRYGRTGTSTDD